MVLQKFDRVELYTCIVCGTTSNLIKCPVCNEISKNLTGLFEYEGESKQVPFRKLTWKDVAEPSKEGECLCEGCMNPDCCCNDNYYGRMAR